MGVQNPHIIIIEKHTQFSEALKEFILTQELTEQITIYTSFRMFMDERVNGPHPDIVLIDAMLIGKESTRMLREYLALHPHIVSIALSIFSGIPRFEELVALGFKGYVNKNQVYTQLMPAIESTLKGAYHFPYRN